MAECEHLARTTAYFDGALSPADEAVAAEHLATCAACQGVLGDAVALDAVLSTEKRAPANVRRRWPLIVAIAGGLAVAAAATYVVWPRPKPITEQTIALASERAIEARFTGDQFGKHRPLGVLRGDRRVETISLAQLAQLEQRREHRDLVAALAATGDLERARSIVATLPADAASESDRAAVALAVRDHEGAIAHAYRALALQPTLAPAWWNLGLAARDLGLLRASKAAFARVADGGEVGWADEARAHVAAIDKELAGEVGFGGFDKRGRAMVDGGPPIEVADVRRYPAFARVYTLDALRTASGPRIDELRPLATELDALSGTHTMIEAADRAAKADGPTRAKFADRYRAVVARTLTGPDLTKFVDELRKAGPAVEDLRASAIILGGLAEARNAELRAIVAPWHDPWFDYAVELQRIRASFPDNDLRAEPALIAALATCTNDAWSLRCGQLAHELAQLLKNTGRMQEAEAPATRAIALFRTAGSPVHVATSREMLGDIHRHLGRNTLARVELEDALLVENAACGTQRYAAIALADLAFADGDWPRVRNALPPAIPPPGCKTEHEIQGIGTAADLARRTKDAADLSRAQQWIDAFAAHEDRDGEGNALVAKARIGDAAALAAVRKWVAVPAKTPLEQELRTWAFTTLITDAGTREAWTDVLALAHEEHPTTAAPCTVVASFDDNVLTVAAKTPAGTIGAHRSVTPASLGTEVLVGPDITRALAACTAIAVAARSPLHGRADLLPAALPWWFAGDAPAHERGTAAKSVEVTNPRAPDLALPPLATAGTSTAKFDVSLTGAAATPSRVLAALADATYVELHGHGIATSMTDTAFLALSPDSDGTFALRADTLRVAKLARAPIVVLAACRAAAVAPLLRARWSLPDAFLAAGAHAVVAADIPIPDTSARRVFDDLHRRLDAGESIASAVAAIRAGASGDTAWATHLMVFR